MKNVPQEAAVPLRQDEDVPIGYALLESSSNPASSITSIRYALPKPSHVQLHVYNMLGAKLNTLLDAQQNAGFHTAVWNGKTILEETVTTKELIIRMRAEAVDGSEMFISAKKLVRSRTGSATCKSETQQRSR